MFLRTVLRFSYAGEAANYALACNDEADTHYGLRSSKLYEFRIFLGVFLCSLFQKQPEWYVHDWCQRHFGISHSSWALLSSK